MSINKTHKIEKHTKLQGGLFALCLSAYLVSMAFLMLLARSQSVGPLLQPLASALAYLLPVFVCGASMKYFVRKVEMSDEMAAKDIQESSEENSQ